MADKKPIYIFYSYIDGAHFFTSKDQIAKGLCVAHSDLAAAFNEVTHQLKVLLKKNHGIESRIKSQTPYEVLEKWANKEIEQAKAATRDGFFVPLPSAKISFAEAA